MAPRLATQQAKDQPSKSTTTWDAYRRRQRPTVVACRLGVVQATGLASISARGSALAKWA
jgi:hypothetical protein